MLVFDAAAGKRLRDNLHTLMRDCDRRQELLQELIATNNQLRSELREQTAASEKLKTQLDDSVSLQVGEVTCIVKWLNWTFNCRITFRLKIIGKKVICI